MSIIRTVVRPANSATGSWCGESAQRFRESPHPVLVVHDEEPHRAAEVFGLVCHAVSCAPSRSGGGNSLLRMALTNRSLNA